MSENEQTTHVQNQSLGTPKLNEAFSKAQGEFRTPTLNRTAVIKNAAGQKLYETSYADLQEIIDCIRKPLSQNGLSFTQKTLNKGGNWALVLELKHASGETDVTYLPIKVDQTNQQLGGTLTYLKRYQLSAYFGIAADFDDDGVEGTGNTGEFSDKKKADNQKPPTEKPKNHAPQALGNKPKAVSNSGQGAPPLAKQPEPEDIPQTQPDYEHQPQTPAGQKKGPGDYVIAYGSKKFDGKKIKDVSESDLRGIYSWIATELKKVPPPKNLSLIFDLQTSIRLFFESMDIKI